MVERIGDKTIELQPIVDLSKLTPATMANQFEAMVLQSTLKTSCIDQHFKDELNPVSAPKLPHMVSTNAGVTEANAIVSDNKPLCIDQSIDQFVTSIWPAAKQLSQLIDLDPKMILAQVALETGWGKFIAKDSDGSSSNNFFNIKSKPSDESVHIKTTEYIAGTPVHMTASFKKYSSIEHSFNDYLSLIKGERYKSALANTRNPECYIDALHQAGFATDPNYANKILSIYHGDELQHALDRNGFT